MERGEKERSWENVKKESGEVLRNVLVPGSKKNLYLLNS